MAESRHIFTSHGCEQIEFEFNRAKASMTHSLQSCQCVIINHAWYSGLQISLGERVVHRILGVWVCDVRLCVRYSLRDERSSSLIDIYGQMHHVLHRQNATKAFIRRQLKTAGGITYMESA